MSLALEQQPVDWSALRKTEQIVDSIQMEVIAVIRCLEKDKMMQATF